MKGMHMFEILIPILIFAGIFFWGRIPVLTDYDYYNVALTNIVISVAFFGFEILNYFYPDKFRLFWTRFYKRYREIFAKTIELYFEKIQKVCIVMTGAFVAVHLLLAYYHFAIYLEFSFLILMSIGVLYQFSLFVCASSEERLEYLNFLKQEYTTFSKSGISSIAGVLVIGSLFLYNLQYGDSGTCFVDAGNYESIMKGSFEKITSVQIRKNSITEQQIISVLKKCDPEKLRKLNLNGGKLSDNFWETAKKFHKLTRLEFWDVDISKLPEFFAESFPSMEHLIIYGSKNLKEFPNGIEKLQKLKYMTLDTCGLRKLPKNIEKLKNLSRLYISFNPLESIEELCSLRNLVILDVSGCKLKSLPRDIINLKKLEELSIGNNDFIAFPKQIHVLKKLVQLNANGLNLKSVPKEILELKNLSNLNLSRNQLESLPDEILNLKNLRYLYLGKNKFKTIPPQLLKIPYLKELSLKNNQLRELPSEMEDLITKLSYLNISHNKFQTRPTILQKFKGQEYCLQEEGNPYNKSKETSD